MPSRTEALKAHLDAVWDADGVTATRDELYADLKQRLLGSLALQRAGG